MNIKNISILKIHQGLKKREFSVLELTKEFLEKIKREDKAIGAFLEITEKEALEEARKIDQTISKEKDFPVLTGVPCAIKDIILVKGIRCTAGSKFLKNYIAPYDATVIKKLKEQRVVILGKTNLDEFAMGSSTENSAFFPTRNPHNLERVPGGSSGGSAAAVASNFCAFALGSDTGGSIRQPASFCGVVGLKPTYGAVSRFGLIAFASSLDQIGPMARTPEDAEIVFEAIKGKDEKDSTSLYLDYLRDSKFKIQDIKIGVPKEYFIKGIDPQVEKIIKEAIKKYEERGVKIEEISLPHTEYALPCYYIIASSEASANLARYDGIRYGTSFCPVSEANSSLEVYLVNRARGFGEEVKRRIMLGTYSLSAGYYDAYYLRAQKVRRLVKKDFEQAFRKVDFIFTPVAPTPAFKLGEKTSDPLSMYLSDIFTIPVSLAGLPAVSISVGKTEGLPVGMQIIGKPFQEKAILEIAKLYGDSGDNSENC